MSARWLAALLAMLSFGACGMQPMAVRQDDMARGPGIFTGAAGEWVLTPDMLRQRPPASE